MAGTATVFTKWAKSLGDKLQNIGTDVLKVTLHTSTYVPNRDTAAVYADVTNELTTAGGYTAGGQTLVGVSWAVDAANHRGKLTATNPSWAAATFTARIMVLRNTTTDELIAWYDFGADQSPAGVTFTFAFDPTAGVLTLTCS
jgi:hypothetical protein